MGDALIVRRTISGGGLKDTDAVLIVTVKTGSTVTATKGGVALTPTIWVQSADNTMDTAIFAVPASTFDANAWTVTATLGVQTKSATIIIDAAKEYDLALAYRIYLIRDGVVQNGFAFSTSVTYVNSSHKGAATAQAGYINLKSDAGYTMVYSTDAKVDISAFTTVSAHIKLVTSVTNTSLSAKLRGTSLFPLSVAHPNTSTSAALAGYINEYANVTTTGETTLQLDISALTEEQYINIAVGGYSSSYGQAYVYDIYLE